MPYKENLEKGDYMNIFISYSHIDKEFALKLSSALEADGKAVSFFTGAACDYNYFFAHKIILL